MSIVRALLLICLLFVIVYLPMGSLGLSAVQLIMDEHGLPFKVESGMYAITDNDLTHAFSTLLNCQDGYHIVLHFKIGGFLTGYEIWHNPKKSL